MIIQTLKLNDGKRFEIVHDDSPESPRNESPLGTIYHWHSRYDLGEKVSGLQDIELEAGDVSLPIYMYEHGGISISTKPFSCRWDSGQVGMIVLTKAEAEREFFRRGYKVKAVQAALVGVVEEYGHYLAGECYGYRVLKQENVCSHCDRGGKWIEEGSWGYTGEFNNDLVEVMLSDAGHTMAPSDEHQSIVNHQERDTGEYEPDPAH